MKYTNRKKIMEIVKSKKTDTLLAVISIAFILLAFAYSS